MTCTKNEFALSDEGAMIEKRVNLGNVTFDNNVHRLGEGDVIYTVREERTAFFSFSYDTKLVEEEKKSDCKVPSVDLLKPRKGDVYLLIKLVNPQNGKSVIVRRQI